MGRSRRSTRRALKDTETRDILRDRDRKLSSFDQLLPPDSNALQPSRILRSDINSYRMPARSPTVPVLPSTTNAHQMPAPFPSPEKFTKEDSKTLKQMIHIEKRAQLMSTRSIDVFDLTNIDPDIDTDGSGEVAKSCILKNDGRNLNVFVSAGFAGYLKQSTGKRKALMLQSLQSPPELQRFLHKFLRYELGVLGLRQDDIEISGYEVQFPEDYVYHGVTIQADQRVLTRSHHLLIAWADQAINHQSSLLHKMIVRIVKSDGSIFDTTFRTPRELLAKPIAPGDSIEPSMQDSPSEVKSAKMSSTKQKKQIRHHSGDKILTRRERVVRRAILRLDMLKVEDMMAGQCLSGDTTDCRVDAVSGLPSGVSLRSDGIGLTETDGEHVERGMRDLEMT